MSRIKLLVLLAGMLVALLGLGITAIAAPGHAPNTIKQQTSSGDTIVIDPEVGEVFVPDGSGGASRVGILSPEEAYRGYSGDFSDIPKDWTWQLGSLTLPLGSEPSDGYTAKDEYVYAFTVPACGPKIVPPPVGGDTRRASQEKPQHSDSACMQWLFVDATTGHMVDMTWTQ